MGLFGFFRREEVDLKSYLRQTKKVRIHGINFEIRKIDLDDHLAGLKVIVSMHQIYKVRKDRPSDPGTVAEDNAKLRKFIRDFVYAGVVSPKLTMKKEVEEGEIHVDELTANGELSQALCVAILEHSYGKKKL